MDRTVDIEELLLEKLRMLSSNKEEALAKTKERPLARKVFNLQVAFVRKINDAHIFARQSIPLLKDARSRYEDSDRKKDRRYYVPGIGRAKFARRKDKELKEIYDRFISRELYENLIVTAVSYFESFLFDVLKLILIAYPQKLSLNIRGEEKNRDIPLDVLLKANDLQDVLHEVIERRLHTLSYANPKAYLDFAGKVVGTDVSDTVFQDYLEIKATRDLIIHNAGIINQIYTSKAGDKHRGKVGNKIMINSRYFDHCVATLKRISGIIKRDVERNFPVSKSGQDTTPRT